MLLCPAPSPFRYGAACHGMEEFPFSVGSHETNGVEVVKVPCKENADRVRSRMGSRSRP